MANGDEYIKTRLQQWAEWSAMRESGAVGYPRECSYTRMQARSGAPGFFTPDLDEDAMDVEKAVRELPDYLRATVREYYVAPGTVEQKAKSLCCNKNTIYLRLERAHALISDWMQLHRKK
jgi:DNA-directed RNA polymerase specialized sigma24 family protein